MRFGNVFQPYRLPDAGGARVKTAVRGILLALLARRDEAVSRIVLRVHAQNVFPLMHIGGNIRFEGDVPALMRAALYPVDIDRRLVIHRAEMKEDPPPEIFLFNGEFPPVPDGGHKIPVPDPRKRAFGTEGHVDLFGIRRAGGKQPALFPAARSIALEFPDPVEIFPCFPHELRLRMFAPVHTFSPFFVFNDKHSIHRKKRIVNSFFSRTIDISYCPAV